MIVMFCQDKIILFIFWICIDKTFLVCYNVFVKQNNIKICFVKTLTHIRTVFAATSNIKGMEKRKEKLEHKNSDQINTVNH